MTKRPCDSCIYRGCHAQAPSVFIPIFDGEEEPHEVKSVGKWRWIEFCYRNGGGTSKVRWCEHWRPQTKYILWEYRRAFA